MNPKDFLDKAGVTFLWLKIKDYVASKMPTKTSQLANDSVYIPTEDIPEGATASTPKPKMVGEAAVGIELAFARGDHVHPSDTTKVDKIAGKGLSTYDFSFDYKTKLDGIEKGANNYVLPKAASASLGGVMIGENVGIDSGGKISVPAASSSKPGVVQLSTGISGEPSNTTKAATPKAVADYVKNAVGTPFKFGGNVGLSDLPAMPTANDENLIYNIKSAFTTTKAFVEGEGISYPAGSNIIVVSIDGGFKYDVLTGFFDLSPYQRADELVPISNDELAAIIT